MNPKRRRARASSIGLALALVSCGRASDPTSTAGPDASGTAADGAADVMVAGADAPATSGEEAGAGGEGDVALDSAPVAAPPIPLPGVAMWLDGTAGLVTAASGKISSWR